jgi:hypothetical protein
MPEISFSHYKVMKGLKCEILAAEALKAIYEVFRRFREGKLYK